MYANMLVRNMLVRNLFNTPLARLAEPLLYLHTDKEANKIP